jgi:hypothetical protein
MAADSRSEGTYSSTRSAVAPDFREAVAFALSRMRAERWRVISEAARRMPGDMLAVVRWPDDEADLLTSPSPSSTIMLHSDRLPIRRWAGNVSIVFTERDARHFRRSPASVIGPDAYIREERPVTWTETFTPRPTRVRDPGHARRVLRAAGRSSSKRCGISTLKRAAERLLNAPRRTRVRGAAFLVAVSLGHYAFDEVERVVHRWGFAPPGMEEGWAALAWGAWRDAARSTHPLNRLMDTR